MPKRIHTPLPSLALIGLSSILLLSGCNKMGYGEEARYTPDGTPPILGSKRLPQKNAENLEKQAQLLAEQGGRQAQDELNYYNSLPIEAPEATMQQPHYPPVNAAMPPMPPQMPQSYPVTPYAPAPGAMAPSAGGNHNTNMAASQPQPSLAQLQASANYYAALGYAQQQQQLQQAAYAQQQQPRRVAMNPPQQVPDYYRIDAGGAPLQSAQLAPQQPTAAPLTPQEQAWYQNALTSSGRSTQQAASVDHFDVDSISAMPVSLTNSYVASPSSQQPQMQREPMVQPARQSSNELPQPYRQSAPVGEVNFYELPMSPYDGDDETAFDGPAMQEEEWSQLGIPAYYEQNSPAFEPAAETIRKPLEVPPMLVDPRTALPAPAAVQTPNMEVKMPRNWAY